MIGISFHSGGYLDQPLPWAIERLARIGYDAIEIVCGPEAHIRTGKAIGPQLAKARRWLTAHHLQVAAINPLTMPAMANLAKEDRPRAELFWTLLMDIALELNCRNVNFLPGWLPDGDAETWKILIDLLKTLTRKAEEKGVYLAIHNHEGMVIDTPDKCLALIEQVGSPHLRVLCDITNFYILGSDVAQAVQRVGPHIVHCHAKGVIGKYPFNEFLVAGDERDQLPFDDFARALGQVGYTGYISAENFRWLREDRAEVSYKMMSERLRALGLRP